MRSEGLSGSLLEGEVLQHARRARHLHCRSSDGSEASSLALARLTGRGRHHCPPASGCTAPSALPSSGRAAGRRVLRLRGAARQAGRCCGNGGGGVRRQGGISAPPRAVALARAVCFRVFASIYGPSVCLWMVNLSCQGMSWQHLPVLVSLSLSRLGSVSASNISRRQRIFRPSRFPPTCGWKGVTLSLSFCSEREREGSITPFQPHRADAGAARTCPDRSHAMKYGCNTRTSQHCPADTRIRGLKAALSLSVHVCMRVLYILRHIEGMCIHTCMFVCV